MTMSMRNLESFAYVGVQPEFGFKDCYFLFNFVINFFLCFCELFLSFFSVFPVLLCGYVCPVCSCLVLLPVLVFLGWLLASALMANVYHLCLVVFTLLLYLSGLLPSLSQGMDVCIKFHWTKVVDQENVTAFPFYLVWLKTYIELLFMVRYWINASWLTNSL